ncbi:MAG: sugar O-acetyltransferase [Christensenellales bacterium]
MTEKQKMLAGELYYANDPELAQARLHARRLCRRFNELPVDASGDRVSLLGELFGSCGENAWIEPDFRCDYGFNIHVEDDFYANFDCVILDVAQVHIGKNCFMAPQVGIYTATHPLAHTQRDMGLESAKPVRIGESCWIGGHAVILPGVTLGDRVVVGAGAVVTKSFGDDVVIAGNPARVIKRLGE